MKLFATDTKLWTAVKRVVIQKKYFSGYLERKKGWIRPCVEKVVLREAFIMQSLQTNVAWRIDETWLMLTHGSFGTVKGESGNLLRGVQLCWGIWCMRYLVLVPDLSSLGASCVLVYGFSGWQESFKLRRLPCSRKSGRRRWRKDSTSWLSVTLLIFIL